MKVKRIRRYALMALALAAISAAGAWLFARTYKTLAPGATAAIPVTKVKRDDIILSVAAKGSLRGGNSEMLTAPLTGGGEMHLTQLKKTGELVKVGEIVLEFDPTDQEYKLKEAESDLAENNLKVAQAEAQAAADTEEAKYALQKAESDVRVAELDVRKNPILPAIYRQAKRSAVASVEGPGESTANGSCQSRRYEQGCHRGAKSGCW